MSCIVNMCRNKKKKRPLGVSFHRFPKDPHVKLAWVKVLKRGYYEPTGNDYVCSEHFLPHDLVKVNGKTVLKKDAVPRTNLNLNIIPTQENKFKRIRIKNDSMQCFIVRKSVGGVFKQPANETDGYFDLVEEKPNIELINENLKNATESSLVVPDLNEQEQQQPSQQYQQKKTTHKKKNTNQYPNPYQLDYNFQNSGTTSPFPGLSSDFCEVEFNVPSSYQDENDDNDNLTNKRPKIHTSSTSNKNHRNKIKSKVSMLHKKKFPCSSKNINSHNNKINNLEKYENNDDENNLKTFGEFIDEELQKLDENSLAMAKMKISEILHEASMGVYKNRKTDINNKDSNVEMDVYSNDNETENQVYPGNNKENRLSSEFEQHFNSNCNENDNNIECEKSGIFRKKRLKTKHLLSAVYDALNKEINNAEIKYTSFGKYVSNELKMLDNETIRNVKLKICHVLYEASLSKTKTKNKSSDSEQLLSNGQENNTQKLTEIQTIDCTDSDIELIVPKTEIIDSTYEL